jgi:N-hydroxyarylamine O-acetyltransferase
MTKVPVLDLDAYFTRVGYTGPCAPTLETLRALHAKHAASIPFENLNPLLGWPVKLDLASVQQKLVLGGRGGYCFEQNLLFSRVLRALGFSVTDLAARVLWRAHTDDEIRPRTHMLLLVEVQGELHIADVGFGGQSLTGPLRLLTDVEQATPHGPFRLLRVEGIEQEEYKLQALVGKFWKSLYRFNLQPQLEPDFEMPNHYLCTSAESHFRTTLLAARALPDRRYGLANNFLSTHHLKAPSERRALRSIAEVRQVLEEVFGLRLPEAGTREGAQLDSAVSRVCELPH